MCVCVCVVIIKRVDVSLIKLKHRAQKSVKIIPLTFEQFIQYFCGKSVSLQFAFCHIDIRTLPVLIKGRETLNNSILRATHSATATGKLRGQLSQHDLKVLQVVHYLPVIREFNKGMMRDKNIMGG